MTFSRNVGAPAGSIGGLDPSKCRRSPGFRLPILLAVTAMLGFPNGCASLRSMMNATSSHQPGVEVDSVTVALWKMDELVTTEPVRDSGVRELHGYPGADVTFDRGHRGNALALNGQPSAFVLVPFPEQLNGLVEMSIEAWVFSDSCRGLCTVAARWTPAREGQSWLFGITSTTRIPWVQSPHPGPPRITPDPPLVFAYLPSRQKMGRVVLSRGAVPHRRWTHVAVTCDGRNVAFYIDGKYDSAFPAEGVPASSSASLTIGGLPELLMPGGPGDYWGRGMSEVAFVGLIDDLRISSRARSSFGNPTAAKRGW